MFEKWNVWICDTETRERNERCLLWDIAEFHLLIVEMNGNQDWVLEVLQEQLDNIFD